MKQALVIAGGLGTRLHPFTKVIPKPLLPVGDQTLLERHVAMLSANGYARISIAIHYFADLFRGVIDRLAARHALSIKVLHEPRPLGTFGSALNLCRVLSREQAGDDPMLVVNADIVSSIDTSAFHAFASSRPGKLVAAVNDYLCSVPYGVVDTDDSTITGIQEKPQFRFPVLAGLYCVRPSIVECCPFPHDAPLGVDTVIQALLARGEPISFFRHSGSWVDAGTLDDLVRAHELFERSEGRP
jgi:NDP-sugar pyrophosphorylase family protein